VLDKGYIVGDVYRMSFAMEPIFRAETNDITLKKKKNSTDKSVSFCLTFIT